MIEFDDAVEFTPVTIGLSTFVSLFLRYPDKNSCFVNL
ncbi:hypothetical protein HM1_2364 [Heliomicrobium modesticaldum Ice1]|uniref:Uncharacterized protein n=1 Tax=Heliobacterium modesticaldum (strain ATCC 51547 / Ice1) TaxID=498761 RepID=B0TIH3_HELMI|nr:hypothetical protein HM1_2364 [Heliomicrobium modesticaldum Ice1]